MSEVPEDRLYFEEEVKEDEDGIPHIGFDGLIGRFTIVYGGRIHYFESYETAEDWYKLNKSREE